MDEVNDTQANLMPDPAPAPEDEPATPVGPEPSGPAAAAGPETVPEPLEPVAAAGPETAPEPLEPVAAAGPEAAGAAETPERPMTMADLLRSEEEYLPSSLERGSFVDGTVIRKDASGLVLDIGAKQEGMVPANDLARLPKEVVDAVSVGDTVTVVVLRTEGREGEILASLYQAQSVADWERAKAVMESGEVLELAVEGFNKGGALVSFGHLQGFVPLSHLVSGGRTASSADRLAELVGQTMAVKVIEVSRKRRRLIMSERQAMREWRAERKQALIKELTEGEVRTGVISSVADFGAFVDLGGADGLVHVSELTHDRGRHPRDIVQVGQEVEVYVLSVDRERKRIGLSMKRLQKDPWRSVEADHYVGELVEGTVANIAKFGAFVRLADGLEGLVHVSELADDRIEYPKDAVRVGQRVTAEIISIDPDRRRLGLSLRRVPEQLRTQDELPAEDDAGDDADVPVADAPAADAAPDVVVPGEPVEAGPGPEEEDIAAAGDVAAPTDGAMETVAADEDGAALAAEDGAEAAGESPELAVAEEGVASSAAPEPAAGAADLDSDGTGEAGAVAGEPDATAAPATLDAEPDATAAPATLDAEPDVAAPADAEPDAS